MEERPQIQNQHYRVSLIAKWSIGKLTKHAIPCMVAVKNQEQGLGA